MRQRISVHPRSHVHARALRNSVSPTNILQHLLLGVGHQVLYGVVQLLNLALKQRVGGGSLAAARQGSAKFPF